MILFDPSAPSFGGPCLNRSHAHKAWPPTGEGRDSGGKLGPLKSAWAVSALDQTRGAAQAVLQWSGLLL